MEKEETKFQWSYVFDEPTRILVVDDDPILCEFASVYLSTPAAEVETVRDGDAALDRMLTSRFDVALVDIEMPGVDGFELVRRVRAQASLRHLPLVMLTSREDIVSIDRAYNLGATSFVTKPVNWRELSYQLRYVIRASRMEAREKQAEQDLSQEIGEAVNAIIACAKLIAEGRDPATQAENIVALGQELLREFPHIGDAAHDCGADCDQPVAPRNAA
jgi:two-component system sensor histidine kinase/response regulator